MNRRIPHFLAAALALITSAVTFSGRDFLAAIARAEARSHAASRDWRTAPAIVEMPACDNLYALGDVHGDYDRLTALLASARLIKSPTAEPTDAKWSGGSAILVCTGDLIDKGKHSLKVIKLVRTLQADARAAGGRVIVTMGNHEAEFLASGANDNKAEDFLKELQDNDIDPQQVVDGTDRENIGTYLQSLPFAAKVGDWFFAHACNTDGRTLAALERKLQDSVDTDGYGADFLAAEDSLLEARLHPIPWWRRPGDTPAESEARLREFAQALGAKHLVMGHQPGKAEFSDGTKRKKGELIQKFDALIFLIDVGMSKAIDYSEGAILHVSRQANNESAVIVFPSSQTVPLWSNMTGH